jgi:hypothetical protein
MVASKRAGFWLVYDRPRFACGYKVRPVIIRVLRRQKNPRISSKGYADEGDYSEC